MVKFDINQLNKIRLPEFDIPTLHKANSASMMVQSQMGLPISPLLNHYTPEKSGDTSAEKKINSRLAHRRQSYFIILRVLFYSIN